MTFDQWYLENFPHTGGLYDPLYRAWHAGIESTQPKQKIPALLDKDFPQKSNYLYDDEDDISNLMGG